MQSCLLDVAGTRRGLGKGMRYGTTTGTIHYTLTQSASGITFETGPHLVLKLWPVGVRAQYCIWYWFQTQYWTQRYQSVSGIAFETSPCPVLRPILVRFHL